MQLLASWSIKRKETTQLIQLLLGDLTQLPPEQAVDALIVSAFQNDYRPTPSSLIGALSRAGISVAQIAESKQWDMRQDFSCWLSRPVVGTNGFRRLLCIESGWRGTPPEITDDLFRALAPCAMSEFPNGSVAMPIVGAGDQGWPVERMLESILRAAVSWFRRGLSISVLKIVVFSPEIVAAAKKTFLEVQQTESTIEEEKTHPHPNESPGSSGNKKGCDIFFSYSHSDMEAANVVVEALAKHSPGIRVFHDKTILKPGGSWLMEIADSLDNAARVLALYTPDYWSSSYCKDEFTAAWTRQTDTQAPILFPIYFRTASIPYLFRSIQHVDCREGDLARLSDACQALCRSFS